MINTSPSLYFAIDGVPSHTPGWRHVNPLELAKPSPKRGTQPRIIPGTHGSQPQKLWRNFVERAPAIHVYGHHDQDGVAASSEIEGLQANMDFLVAAWAPVPATSDSTRTLTLHRRGATKSGPCQVIDIDWDYQEMPVAATLTLRLLLPLGELS